MKYSGAMTKSRQFFDPLVKSKKNIKKSSEMRNIRRRHLFNRMVFKSTILQITLYKISIYLREQNPLNADPRAMQQINFNNNLQWNSYTDITDMLNFSKGPKQN